MERTTSNWAYVPKLFPFDKKQALENIIWLIVWNHAKDNMVKYALPGDSLGSRLCFIYLNFKSVLLGRIRGIGGIVDKYRFISDPLNVVKYLRTDRKKLYLKIKKRMLKKKMLG